MSIVDLKKGDKAIITNLKAQAGLKHRLASFGITSGKEVLVSEYSLSKSTIKIIINNTMAALRFSEAEKIQVKRV